MRLLPLAFLATLAACRPAPADAPPPTAPTASTSPPTTTPASDIPVSSDSSIDIAGTIADPARPQTNLDAGREPADLLAFLHLKPGTKAADIGFLLPGPPPRPASAARPTASSSNSSSPEHPGPRSRRRTLLA